MLQNLRTRSGKLLVVFLVLCGFALFFGLAMEPDNQEAGQTRISQLVGRMTGRKPAYGAKARERHQKQAAKEAAAAAAAAHSADYSTSATVLGITYDETGKPLPGVKITIRRAGGVEPIKTSESDKDGRFAADSLPADTYDILAMHDKFVPLIRPSFTIKPGETQVPIDFHMPLGATINGLVVNEEGQPLTDVRVAARRQKADESKQDGKVLMDDSTYHTQVTDAAGTFTLTGISQGNNVFEIVAAGYAMERMTVDITPEKAAEQMKVTLKKTGVIAGTVVDESNRPVSTATVSLTRYKPLRADAQPIDKGKITVTTGADGKFKFEKLFNEGYYDLLVEEPQFAPGIFPLVAVNSDRVTCPVGIGGEISGTTKLIDRESTEVSVLVQAISVIKGTTYTQEATSDGAGKFKFKKLPYGAYSLKVDDGKYLSEPKDGVACEREKPARDVLLELFQTAKVSGRVSDNVRDSPVAGAKVTLQATYGLDQSRRKTFTLEADGHGMFEFDKLPAGIHVAQAEARGYLKGQTEKSQQSFVLEPGERKGDVNLYLDHGASVEGFVLDPDGRSLQDVDIQLFAASQFDGRVDPAKLKGKTDSTGYFKIWGIEVGERVQLYASASRSGYTKTMSDLIELSPEMMNQQVQINMSRGGTITGIVTDRNKMPIPGAEVRLDSQAFPGDPTPSNVIVHSAANGTYRVDNAPPGGAAITVSRAGFVKQGRGVTVRDAKTADNINFELENGNMIAGVVEDLEGNPIAGAKVQAAGINGAAGSEEDTTDKKGKFELNNLGKGEFRLTATFKLTTPEGEQNYQFSNPKVPSGTAGASIDCDLGNTTSGRVEGEKHKGVQNFTVTLNSKGDTKPAQDFVFNLGRGQKDSGGYFRMSKIPRGLYKLSVSAEGYEPYVEDDVAIGPHRRTVLPSIRLNPAGGIIGRVFSNTTDRPVNNAAVKLVSVGDLPGQAPKTVAGATNMRGEFRLATVPEGLYRVTIDHPSYIGTKLDMIHVTEKKERDLGKLFLEPGGTIRGTIKNHLGDPVPSMTVTVKGVTPAKQATTDAAGNYIIQGIQFGRWPVVVQGNMSGKPIYTFQTSDVQRDESERLDFLLETTSDLKGTLMASAEAAMNSAAVSIHPFDENNVVLENVHYNTHTSTNEFAINEVPPGQYFMWVAGQTQQGACSAWKNLFLQRGTNRTSVEISSTQVQGTITNAQGQPMPNVNVQALPLFGAPNLTQSLYNKLIRPAITDANGNFCFNNLQPGAWQLLNQVPASGGWYAQPTFSLGSNQRISGLNLLTND